MRRLLAAFVLPAALAAGAAAAVKNPETFVYAAAADIDSFDPAWAYDTMSHNIIANVYEYLLDFRGSGTTVKDLTAILSEKVPSRANGLISADGLTYRFPIRKGVKFHDGSLLTPEDVRYSLLRFMLADRDGGPSQLLLSPILGLETTRSGGKPVAGLYERAAQSVRVEGGSVVVRLHRPFAPLLSVLANFGAVVSKPWCAAHGQWDGRAETWMKSNDPAHEDVIPNELANGTGPFRLERFERTQSQVTLARHDAYWRGPARLARVVVKKVDEFATRKLMIQAGDADVINAQLIYQPQVQNLEGVSVIDDLTALEAPTFLSFTFKLDPVANPNIGSGRLDGSGIPPDFFSDKDARKAFAYAIDYAGYIRDIQRGKGRQAAGIIPPGLVGRRTGPPRYRLDLRAAAEHMRKAWGGSIWEKGFKASIVFNTGSPQAQTLCQMIKKNVESLNPKFKLDVRSVQWSTYLEQTQGRKIPLFIGGWGADYPDSHNFAFPLAHSAGYYPGRQGYSNPQADKLIEAAAVEQDEAERARLYGRLQDILDEDVPHVPIAENVRYRAQRSWVKGFVFKPTFPDMPYGSYYYDLSKSE
ncbi:MAG: hypothetical protein A2V88_10885 [Elusimicrobia bacterium RBG_16_66_12]|nr:MAG: hypothetical protein A2V88_10885 [Elusimicrobia bacterium RBG_16_66_12]